MEVVLFSGFSSVGLLVGAVVGEGASGHTNVRSHS